MALYINIYIYIYIYIHVYAVGLSKFPSESTNLKIYYAQAHSVNIIVYSFTNQQIYYAYRGPLICTVVCFHGAIYKYINIYIYIHIYIYMPLVSRGSPQNLQIYKSTMHKHIL